MALPPFHRTEIDGLRVHWYDGSARALDPQPTACPAAARLVFARNGRMRRIQPPDGSYALASGVAV